MSISYEDARQNAEDPAARTGPQLPVEPPPVLPPDVVKRGSGFFDPDHTGEPSGTIHLIRSWNGTSETFKLDGRIGYLDKHLGAFIVPDRSTPFDTDFASIPPIFTWLIPKSGNHLPAAILHDGFTPPKARTYVGPDITQQQADRMFRDGMRDLGTGGIRRWLAWTAVAFATEAKEGFVDRAWKTRPGLMILARLAVFLGVIVLLGAMATLDLFDGAGRLPWMADTSISDRLVAGGCFAIAIPGALSLLFITRGMTRAALILGIAIALLIHVTVAIALLLLAFNTAEAILAAIPPGGSWRDVARSLGMLGAATTAILLIVSIANAISIGGDWSFMPDALERIADGLARCASWYWDLPRVIPLILLSAFGGLAIRLSRPRQTEQAAPGTSS